MVRAAPASPCSYACKFHYRLFCRASISGPFFPSGGGLWFVATVFLCYKAYLVFLPADPDVTPMSGQCGLALLMYTSAETNCESVHIANVTDCVCSSMSVPEVRSFPCACVLLIRCSDRYLQRIPADISAV